MALTIKQKTTPQTPTPSHDNGLSSDEQQSLAAFEALTEAEQAVLLRQQGQQAYEDEKVRDRAQNAFINDHMVAYNSSGKLQTSGTISPDTIINLSVSGGTARAADLVAAGAIPASAIGMAYDDFMNKHGK